MASSPKRNLFHLQYALLSSDTRAKSSRSSSNQPRDAPRIVSRTELKFWHLISRKKRTLSLKFRSTLILKFISPKKRSCQISKARKLTCLAFCLGPLNPPSCSSSHRGSFLRFKRSYRKSFTLRNAENLLLILPKV